MANDTIITELFYGWNGTRSKEKAKPIKLSEHFYRYEFTCHCGNSHPHYISKVLIDKLEQLRAALGNKKMTVNSGYRCFPYNNSKAVGSNSASQHPVGTAADIYVEGMDPLDVADAADYIGFGGIGRYPSNSRRKGFTHVDVREGYARWEG
jgi:uncharacterized protein YcbK (DUF882 family)